MFEESHQLVRRMPGGEESPGAAAVALARLAAVDFFCGAGGFTHGALQAGALVLCGIDCEASVAETYRLPENNRNGDGSPVAFLHTTVEALRPETLSLHLDRAGDRPLLFIGCPPCQPYSKLRKGQPSPEELGALGAFLRHVLHFRPRFVVVENVPQIRSPRYGSLWQEAQVVLAEAGYQVREGNVDALDYGVPQHRLRALLVADRDAPPPWPRPTCSRQQPQTVRAAIGHLPVPPLLQRGQLEPGDDLHVASRLSPKNLSRIRAIREPGGSRTAWPEELQLPCYRRSTGFTDVYGRMAWERPAPTLTTRFVSLSNGRFGHPEQDRAITPREGALLQSFPPTYRFLAPGRDLRVRQIGNAVPPRMAQAVVTALLEALGEGG